MKLNSENQILSANNHISTEPFVDRLAAKRQREAEIIAKIDAALGGPPKLSHPPVYKDEDLLLDYHRIAYLWAKREARKCIRARFEEQKLNIYINRKLK